jgi:hypothetical protein
MSVDETARPGRAVEALAALLIELTTEDEPDQETPADNRINPSHSP